MTGVEGWVVALAVVGTCAAIGGAIGVRWSDRPYLVLLVLVLSFGLLFANSYVGYVQTMDSAVAVEGTVVGSDYSSSTLSVPSGQDGTGYVGTDRNGAPYFVTVEYQYEYDGERFTSNTLWPRGSSNAVLTQESALQRVTQYDPGDSVTVFVDPEEPSDSYIEERHFVWTNPLRDPGYVVGYFWLGGWLLVAFEKITAPSIRSFVTKQFGVKR
ncbi:DUF3592 domain-containing protein [Halopiger goleimassiliensis]|uniref:DUF3592 domain-containing protein n=1 Tax=Halopiger goleimassiliensis TaxID=1293048 RepID=UPI0006778BCF|nr:DUF3592 domain-containing protein [Halopiger goleimassiliensis]